MLSRKYADKRWPIVILLFLRSGLKGARQMRGMSLVERSWLEKAEAEDCEGVGGTLRRIEKRCWAWMMRMWQSCERGIWNR